MSVDYKFAADPIPNEPPPSVHLGFALGTLLLLKFPLFGILSVLALKVPKGSNIYITGHSQGAASATLLRSYLHYGADRPTKSYSFKTYAFAQPKPGNDHYATDFESLFCNTGLAFRVTNSLDWVPQGPLTIEIPSDLNTPNPLTVLTTLTAEQSAALNAVQSTQVGVIKSILPAIQTALQPTAVALVKTKEFPPWSVRLHSSSRSFSRSISLAPGRKLHLSDRRVPVLRNAVICSLNTTPPPITH